MAKVSDAHLEARRRSIILAACSIFSRKGVESATMSEIAAEAGISPGAIYRYFENKEDLARGCLGENALELEAQWKQVPESSSDPMREFGELSRLTFGTLRNPGERIHTLLMLENTLKGVRDEDVALEEMRAGFQQTREAIAQRLVLARERGQLNEAIDPHRIAGALFSFYLGARMAKLVDDSVDTDSQLEEVIRLLERDTPKP